MPSAAEQTSETFANLEKALKVKGSDLVDHVKGVIVFDVGGSKRTLDLSSGSGALTEGDTENADITLTMTDEVFAKLVAGKTNPQQAFIFRQLKLKGSMSKAMKVNAVLEAARAPASKL